MKKLLFITVILLISLSSLVFADSFTNSLFYNGDAQIKLDKETYKPGDLLKAEIIMFNGEQYPIADGFLIIELVYGNDKPIYPSQASDTDVLFYEKVFSNLTLTPSGTRKINFEFPITSKFRNGNYRMDVFFTTKHTPVVGLAHIFLPGKSKTFKIESFGDFPKAKILHSKTWILNETLIGPTGPAAPYNTENIKGRVFFENIDEDSVFNLKVCEWDDATCDKFVIEQNYQVPKNSKFIDFNFKSLKEPDAYAIRLELKKNNELLSLYRSRLVIPGDTVTLRKLAIDKLYLKENDNVNLKVLLFGSPDHYNFPVVKGASLKVFVKDLEKNNIIFEQARELPDLDSASEFLTPLLFNFKSPAKTNRFQVCAEAYLKDNKLAEDYCYIIDTSKFILNDYKITANYEYNEENKELLLELCSLHDSGIAIKTNLQYLLMLNDNLIKNSGKIEINGCLKQSIGNIGKNNYLLLVNDLEQKKQHQFNIDLAKLEKEEIKKLKLKITKSYTLYGIVLFILILILLVMIISRIRKKPDKYYTGGF